MASSTVLLSVLLAAFVVFADAEVTLSDFSGVWKGYFLNTASAFLTSLGPGLVCIKTLPPDCVAEFPLLEDTYTFNVTTLSLEVRDRIGITTQEQAAERFPVCATYGIYPIETRLTVPPSKILSYDSEAERLYYVDPRRPDVVNCIPLRYRIGAQGPYIELEHSLDYQGTVENVFAVGPSFSCDFVPGRCSVEIDDAGELNFVFGNIFNITCVDGDCLNAIEASEPLASLASNESPVDV